jgi:4-amino-4-deoxy-L-arabinose transferase-like glycosyltransferase
MFTGTESSFREMAGTLLLALLLLLPAAFLRPASRQQELRVLISARNMVESGDYFRPEFQNQPRFRKPPVPYWLAAAAMRPDRCTDSAARARLPFVFAALLLLWTLHRLSGDPRPSLLLLSTFGFWRFAPLAETDILNLLGICLAFRGFQTGRAPTAAAGMTIAALSKGPAGLLIPLLSFLLLRRSHPRPPRFWAGAFLPPLMAGAAWLLFLGFDPAARQALTRELSDTFVSSPHRKHLFYYFLTLPAMLGPVCLLLPWTRISRPPERPAAVWFAVTFVLLSLTASKQNHYALLLLPGALWLLGPLLPLRAARWLAVLAVAAGTVGDLWLSRTSADHAHARFLREVNPRIAEAESVYVTGINSARFDFHAGRHVLSVPDLSRALRRARAGDAVLVIQERGDVLPPDAEPAVEAGDGKWIRALYLPPLQPRSRD